MKLDSQFVAAGHGRDHADRAGRLEPFFRLKRHSPVVNGLGCVADWFAVKELNLPIEASTLSGSEINVSSSPVTSAAANWGDAAATRAEAIRPHPSFFASDLLAVERLPGRPFNRWVLAGLGSLILGRTRGSRRLPPASLSLASFIAAPTRFRSAASSCRRTTARGCRGAGW